MEIWSAKNWDWSKKRLELKRQTTGKLWVQDPTPSLTPDVRCPKTVIGEMWLISTLTSADNRITAIGRLPSKTSKTIGLCCQPLIPRSWEYSHCLCTQGVTVMRCFTPVPCCSARTTPHQPKIPRHDTSPYPIPSEIPKFRLDRGWWNSLFGWLGWICSLLLKSACWWLYIYIYVEYNIYIY